MRRNVAEKTSAEGIRVVSQNISEGVIFDRDGLKVTAFAVDGVVCEHKKSPSISA